MENEFFSESPIDNAIYYTKKYIEEVTICGTSLIKILKEILENKEKFSKIAVEKIQPEMKEMDNLLINKLTPLLNYSISHINTKYGEIILLLKKNLDQILSKISEKNHIKEIKYYEDFSKNDENSDLELIEETEEEESLNFYNSKLENKDVIQITDKEELSKSFTIEVIEPIEKANTSEEDTDFNFSTDFKKKKSRSSMKKLEYSQSLKEDLRSFTVEDLETPIITPRGKKKLGSPLSKIVTDEEPCYQDSDLLGDIYSVTTLFNFNSKIL